MCTYDCVALHFTQTDPRPRGAGSNFESPYVYGYDNPVTFVDPSGERASSANPVKNPIELTFEFPNVRWTDFNISGGCVSASGGFIIGGETAHCELRSAGTQFSTDTLGIGFAWELGAGGGVFKSNARALRDLGGWANCNSFTVGPVSVEVCNLAHGRISVFGGPGLSANVWEGILANRKGLGGHVFASYTWLAIPQFLAPSWCDFHRNDPNCRRGPVVY